MRLLCFHGQQGEVDLVHNDQQVDCSHGLSALDVLDGDDLVDTIEHRVSLRHPFTRRAHYGIRRLQRHAENLLLLVRGSHLVQSDAKTSNAFDRVIKFERRAHARSVDPPGIKIFAMCPARTVAPSFAAVRSSRHSWDASQGEDG